MANNNRNHRNKLITVKDILTKYRVSYQTVNHYTDIGLLSVEFKKGNIRFYDEHRIKCRLEVISKLAREGYSLRLIRRKLLGV